MEWVSVKQELPRGGKMCLIVWNGTVQHIPYSRDGIGFACEEGYEWNAPENMDTDPIPDGEVTHWMYFPPAPPEPEPTVE